RRPAARAGRGRPAMSLPAPVITAELRSLLRAVKLGQLLPTLPERLTLARANSLSHAQFLELILSDEVTRRDATSAARPGRPPRRRRGAGAGRAAGPLRRPREDPLRPGRPGRAVHPAVRRRPPNRDHQGPGGGGKTLPAPRAGPPPHRGPPHRPLRTGRPA